jgi:hypothetical protein
MSPARTAPAHTPGPWHSDWLGDDRGWILDTRANYLAEIVTQDDEGFVVSKAEQRANALLLAAAPELLDALTDLVGGCGKEGDLFSSTAMAKARHALAKVEGR